MPESLLRGGVMGMSVSRGIAAVVAGVALLAGCGAGGGGAAPATPLDPLGLARSAPDTAVAAGSSRFAFSMTFESGATSYAPASTLEVRGEGIYDFEGQIGEAEVVSTGGGLPETRGRSIFENNVSYDQPEGETRWYRTDFTELVDTPVGQQDPAQQLQLLRGVSDGIREVGQEDLRGTPTRRYAITIDPRLLAENVSVVVQGGAVESALQSAEPMPGNVWVDADGRVRKFDVTIVVTGSSVELPPEIANDPAFAEQLAGLRNSSLLTVEYFDFGVPVDVTLPDPALVVDGPAPFALPPN